MSASPLPYQANYVYWVEFKRGVERPAEFPDNILPIFLEVPLHIGEHIEFPNGENYTVEVIWHEVAPTGFGPDHRNNGRARVRLA